MEKEFLEIVHGNQKIIYKICRLYRNSREDQEDFRTVEITEAKNYFKSIIPDGARVTIEFDNDKELGIFHVKVDSIYQSNWNLKIESHKLDSLLTELNLTAKELKTLKSEIR